MGLFARPGGQTEANSVTHNLSSPSIKEMSPCNPYMRELVNQRSLKSVIILKERSLNLAMKSASSQRKPSAFIDEG